VNDHPPGLGFIKGPWVTLQIFKPEL